MRKTLLIAGLFIAAMMLPAITPVTGGEETAEWEECKVSLVSEKLAMEIITPAQIMENKEPSEFTPYLKGKVKGLDMIILDVNNNKQYDDAGTDLMILGKGPYAIPFGKILNIKNELYHFKLDMAAEQICLKPYEGETGRVDLLSKYKNQTKPDIIILASGSGDYFDVAGNKKFLLPCGKYHLWLGYVALNRDHVAIKRGQMEPIDVAADPEKKDKVITVKWGPPLRFDFQFTATADKITVSHQSVQVFGTANEEYYNFVPPILEDITVEGIDAKDALVYKGRFKKC